MAKESLDSLERTNIRLRRQLQELAQPPDQSSSGGSGLPILDEAQDAIRQQKFDGAEEVEPQAPTNQKEFFESRGEELTEETPIERILEVLKIQLNKIENTIAPGVRKGVGLLPGVIAGNIPARVGEASDKQNILGIPIVRGLSDITKQITNLIAGPTEEQEIQEDVVNQFAKELGLTPEQFRKSILPPPGTRKETLFQALAGSGTRTLANGQKIRFMEDGSVRIIR